MKKTSKSNRKPFCVIQFIELPFEGINDYVCVPQSWIISSTILGQRVIVAYPNDKDPLTIQNRAKKKEKYTEEWEFFLAVYKHESDTYEGAVCWITTRKNSGLCEEKQLEEEMKGTQPEWTNKKLCSASYPLFYGVKFEKPLLTVKPYRNLRKPFSKVSIKMLPSTPEENSHTKRSKGFDKTDNPVRTIAKYARNAFKCSKQKESIVRKDNHTKSAVVSNDETNSEHTQTDPNKEEKSFTSDQIASPKPSVEKQPSPGSQNCEQTLSMPVIDVNELNEGEDANNVHFEPILEDKRSSGRTPSTREQTPQPELVIERSISLVHNEQSLLELRQQDVTAAQSKEDNDSQRTQLLQILTAPVTVPIPCSRPNQLSQSKYTQSAYLPTNSAAYLNPHLSATNEGSSATTVTYSQQRPCSQGFNDSTLSTYYCGTNPINLSTKFLHPATRKQSVTENRIDKKTCLENVAGNTSTRQDPSSSTMQFCLPDNSVVMPTSQYAQKYNQSVPLQCTTTLAAQNLSNLAHQSRSIIEQPPHKNYLQQVAYLNNISHYQTAMTTGESMKSKPNSISQPNQFLLQHKDQYIPFNVDSMQQVLRNELLRGSTSGAHTNFKPNTPNIGMNIQFPSQNLSYVSNQSHHNFEYPQQRQNLPKYQDHPYLPCKFKTNSQNTVLQGVIRRTPSLDVSNTSSQLLLNAQQGHVLQDPRIQPGFNQNFTEHQILNPVIPRNITIESKSTRKDFKAQSVPLNDRSDDMRSALLTVDNIPLNQWTRKMMVDQATEMDLTMDVDNCEDETAESCVDENAPTLVDSTCQTDEYLMEDQGSPYQETDSDSEVSTDDVVSNDDVRADDACVNMASDANPPREHVSLESNTEKRPTISEIPPAQRRLVEEQEMLNMFSILFTKMGSNFYRTRDMLNQLQNSIIECAEVYETLLQKVEKFNETEYSTSLPTNVTSDASEKNISENDNENNIIGVSDTLRINHTQKHTFTLPPEYDPNDSKWTLKHREKKPGLVELMPRSNIYVSKTELKNCKRESKDCRTLARMLLIEVFSKNALSVCSLTGGKAKAFKSKNLNVRPGLDEYARMVLLAFIEKYGAKHGWKIDDTSSINNSMRTKILEMRVKFGQAGKD